MENTRKKLNRSPLKGEKKELICFNGSHKWVTHSSNRVFIGDQSPFLHLFTTKAVVISYENDSLKSSFPPWRCYTIVLETDVMWLYCPRHWSYTGHRYSQQPSSQVWPSLRSVWQSLTPLVYMFSWRAFPASDVTQEVRRVSVTCHVSIKGQDSR